MNPVSFATFLMGFVFVAAILVVTIFPLFFWSLVVPDIEKRVGQKLKFKSSYNWFWPIGKYIFGYAETTRIITLMYLNVRIFSEKLSIKYDNDAALIRAKYNIYEASKGEIVFSLFCSFLNVAIVISLVAMFLIPLMFPVK